MAYSPAVVQRARARLAQAKAAHGAETAARLEAAYEKFPELAQIDRQLRATMAQVVAASFRKGEDPAQAIDAFVAKKLKGAAVSDPKELKKVSDALARRGYSWSDISEALRRFGAQWED